MIDKHTHTHIHITYTHTHTRTFAAVFTEARNHIKEVHRRTVCRAHSLLYCVKNIYHPNSLISRLCQVIRTFVGYDLYGFILERFFLLIFVICFLYRINNYDHRNSLNSITDMVWTSITRHRTPEHGSWLRFSNNLIHSYICIWTNIIIGSMKRRNGDCGKSRKALKRNKSATEGIYWRYSSMVIGLWVLKKLNICYLFLVPYIIWSYSVFGLLLYYLIICCIFGLNTFGLFGFCFIKSSKESNIKDL